MPKNTKKIEKKGMNRVLKNLLLGLGFILVIFLAVDIFLHVFTQHRISVAVPDMVGMSLEQAGERAAAEKLSLVVTDSVYVSSVPKGAVFDQNPAAGKQVKRGRKIYLTVNAKRARQVKAPNLVGLSLRQAKVELLSRSLKLGRLIYEEDMATNNVLGQLLRGEPLLPGAEIDAGSTVDLRLGLNPADRYAVVPDFTRQHYSVACEAVKDNSLNLAAVIFDETVLSHSDSLSAFVYRQIPAAGSPGIVLGTSVRLYLTLDAEKLPKEEAEPVE